MSRARTAGQIALGFYEFFMSLIALEPHETDVIACAIGFQSRIFMQITNLQYFGKSSAIFRL